MKQSWANIAEDEAAEVQLLENLEKEHVDSLAQTLDNPPFKLVTHQKPKPKQKQHKTQPTPSNHYSTRSKDEHPNPFR